MGYRGVKLEGSLSWNVGEQLQSKRVTTWGRGVIIHDKIRGSVHCLNGASIDLYSLNWLILARMYWANYNMRVWIFADASRFVVVVVLAVIFVVVPAFVLV